MNNDIEKIKNKKIIPLKISKLEGMTSIIDKTIKQKGQIFIKEYNRRRLLNSFGDILGEAIARRVKPVAIKDNILYLYVPDAVWKNEIKFAEIKIINKLNNFAEEKIIKKIEFIKTYQIINLKKEENYYINKKIQQNIIDKKIKKEISQENISEAEIKRAADLSLKVKDEKLAQKINEIYLKNQKLKKWRINNLLPCPDCGQLITDDESICFDCYQNGTAKIKSAVRNYLSDIPWARTGDITKEIPNADNYLINNIRMDMVKNQIEKIKEQNIRDKNNLEIKTLIMLYKVVKPEELTPEIIDKALYELKNDLKWQI